MNNQQDALRRLIPARRQAQDALEGLRVWRTAHPNLVAINVDAAIRDLRDVVDALESVERKELAALTPAPDAGGETPTTGAGWPQVCGHRCREDRGEGLRCEQPADHPGLHAFGSITWR